MIITWKALSLTNLLHLFKGRGSRRVMLNKKSGPFILRIPLSLFSIVNRETRQRERKEKGFNIHAKDQLIEL